MSLRRYQQRNLLELLETLNQAHEEIRNILNFSAKRQSLNNLLSDCQEAALSICKYIDDIEGEGMQAVAALEEYYELLYKMSIEPSEANLKALEELIIKSTLLVNEELKPNKTVVVFLPYKASMWDSLESVYLASKADPDCIAYCVPIPYYDKNPDRSFGKLHYEGNLYPSHVEITDWTSYDIKKEHPDIIFIHNPYDDKNLVTSVHPDFYSNKLKEYTDLLVFINYGLDLWIRRTPLSDHGNISVFLPLFNNVDLYISDSTEMSEQIKFAVSDYVNSFSKKGVNEKSLEKFVSLGSPKFDKVLNTARANYPIPEEWMMSLITPEGAQKKVILYIHSLQSILKDCESFFINIQNTINVFRNRSDVALWWRPHPLVIETLKAMRSGHLDKYESIVRCYKDEKIGIFDDGAEPNRAIAWSDAYYGHESSMTFLYLATGKPFSIVKPRDLSNFKIDTGDDFAPILNQRIENMQTAKGANVIDDNCSIWWDNFSELNLVKMVQYDKFLERFIDYVVNMENYSNAVLYKQLSLQMFHNTVENSDGTAGQKIHEYCKRKVLGRQ